MDIELDHIGVRQNGNGTETHVLGVPNFIKQMSFSRFSKNVISCRYDIASQMLEVTLPADSRASFEIDFSAVFDPVVKPAAVRDDTLSGTFNGIWDDCLDTDPRPPKQIDYAEITKQISTGSTS